MADYGLLGGLGEGLKQGLLMYQNQKQLQRQNQIQNLTSGVQTDADGNLQLTPQKQQQMQTASDLQKSQLQESQGQNQLQQAQLDKLPQMSQEFSDARDATSSASQHSRQVNQLALKAANPGMSDSDIQKAIPETMSKAELESDSSPVKQMIQGGYSKQAGQLKAQSFQGRVDVMQDNQSEAAVQKIHNDSLIKQMRSQASSIDKGQDQLSDPNHPPSWIQLNEVANDYANALSANKGSSDFKLKQTEQESFDQKLGEIAGYVKSDPNQPADPAYVNFYKQMGDRLSSTYDKQLGQRASSLAAQSSKVYKHNPSAAEAQQDAADSYKNGNWRNDSSLNPNGGSAPAPQQGQSGASNGHPQDQQAVSWAQSNPNDPRSAAILKANGVTSQAQAPEQPGLLSRIKTGLLGG